MTLEMRLLIGLPGAGKTQYATDLMAAEPESWGRINWDDLRAARRRSSERFSRQQENEMQAESFRIARGFAAAGLNIIIDNTNLTPSTRNRWKGLAKEMAMKYTEVDLGASLEDCILQDSRRLEPVGRAVIERMALFAGKIDFGAAEAHKDLVLVDMDGTLADSNHRAAILNVESPCPGSKDWGKPCVDGYHSYRNCRDTFTIRDLCAECKGSGKKITKNWDAYYQNIEKDKLVGPINVLVWALYAAGYKILIVSGRPTDKAGKETVAWLEKYSIPYEHIFMRGGGDHRPDYIVKKEILDRLPAHRILFTIDDRDQVVQMWRKNGLACLQVAEGNF